MADRHRVHARVAALPRPLVPHSHDAGLMAKHSDPEESPRHTRFENSYFNYSIDRLHALFLPRGIVKTQLVLPLKKNDDFHLVCHLYVFYIFYILEHGFSTE